jgi:hypothetical protein
MAQRSMPEWHERDKAWRIGKAAFWGRLGGTLSKVAIATLMVVVAAAALVTD